MSYICLLANKNGAAASGDTRVSKNFSGDKPFKVINNKRRKVFTSNEDKVIWAMAGVTKVFGWDYFKQINRVMKNDSVSFALRLEKYVKIMKRATRRFHKYFKTTGSSTILFASYHEEKAPQIGSITIQNGEVLSDKRYNVPVFVETGSNYAQLSDRKKYVPGEDDTIGELKMNAAKRVAEAVRTDKKHFHEDAYYRPAVGGTVLVKAIEAK